MENATLQAVDCVSACPPTDEKTSGSTLSQRVFLVSSHIFVPLVFSSPFLFFLTKESHGFFPLKLLRSSRNDDSSSFLSNHAQLPLRRIATPNLIHLSPLNVHKSAPFLRQRRRCPDPPHSPIGIVVVRKFAAMRGCRGCQ